MFTTFSGPLLIFSLGFKFRLESSESFLYLDADLLFSIPNYSDSYYYYYFNDSLKNGVESTFSFKSLLNVNPNTF